MMAALYHWVGFIVVWAGVAMGCATVGAFFLFWATDVARKYAYWGRVFAAGMHAVQEEDALAKMNLVQEEEKDEYDW